MARQTVYGLTANISLRRGLLDSSWKDLYSGIMWGLKKDNILEVILKGIFHPKNSTQ